MDKLTTQTVFHRYQLQAFISSHYKQLGRALLAQMEELTSKATFKRRKCSISLRTRQHCRY
jgi:hypothetical protein